MSWLVRYEWAVLELGFLGFLCYQLYSIRRTRRRDREAKEAEDALQRAGHPEGEHRLDPQ